MIRQRLKTIVIFVLIILTVMAGGFLVYVSDYYKADDLAMAAVTGNQNIVLDGNLAILSPDIPSDTALIFYPGGKVEHTAYIPLLEKLTKKGITCVLVKMPFHLAVLDPNAADKVFGKLPDIRNWYIGGHSLGGAMASSYMSRNNDRLKGLILLGAYIYGDVPANRALTVYGSQDGVLDRTKVKDRENVYVIDGGNHAWFGNYGEQKGDGKAIISRETQQDQAAAAIISFIERSR